jgi:hypothetical protein
MDQHRPASEPPPSGATAEPTPLVGTTPVAPLAGGDGADQGHAVRAPDRGRGHNAVPVLTGVRSLDGVSR